VKHRYTISFARVGPVRIQQKRVRTRYAELVFLHLVGSTDHVVNPSASGMENIDALFFIIWWDRYGFGKKRAGTCYTELVFWHPV
jgi:hypothetical protein